MIGGREEDGSPEVLDQLFEAKELAELKDEDLVSHTDFVLDAFERALDEMDKRDEGASDAGSSFPYAIPLRHAAESARQRLINMQTVRKNRRDKKTARLAVLR